jgi:hypothetical protein
LPAMRFRFALFIGEGSGFIISGGGNICMALLYSTRTGWYDEFLESDA